jgi:Zn-dependent protease
VNIFDESLAPRTRFDINFRLGDIPVRVHPFFWLSMIFLGLSGRHEDGITLLRDLLIWVVVVFVSILVHELGHVLMGRYFGREGHIVLTGFCGLAIGSADLPRRWQRNAVSLAGPGAGFLLAAVVTIGSWLRYPNFTLRALGLLFGIEIDGDFESPYPDPWLGYAIYTTLWVNIFWGLVNLLPIWPLDGGHVSHEAFEHFRGRDGMRSALILSMLTSAALAMLGLGELLKKEPVIPHFSLGGTLFPVIFFGLLALQSWQLLQAIRYAGRDWDGGEQQPRAPWEQDADWWKRGDRPWDD